MWKSRKRYRRGLPMELLLGEELNGRKSSRFSAFTRGALLGCVCQGLVPRWLFAHTVCLASDKKLRVTQLPAFYLTNKLPASDCLQICLSLSVHNYVPATSEACIILGSHRVWAAVKAARRRISFPRIIKHRTCICKIGWIRMAFPCIYLPMA